MVHQYILDHPNAATLNVEFLDRFALSKTYYESIRECIYSEAREQAKTQWETIDSLSEKDLKFRYPNPNPSTPGEETPMAVKEVVGKVILKDAEKEYGEELSKLEQKNEEEFSVFWVERVTSRNAVYNSGLQAVEDAKLQGQLSELLFAYLLKELVPESISKARSQGLTRSRKTVKNLQKLESVLKKEISDLPKLGTALDKFSKKQTLPVVDEFAVTESRNVMAEDMIRKMQKQSDGPLLFLTLVVVLLAKKQRSLVYATGKFAPKLMKQLKSSLSEEDFGQLEKWKELAKAGSLTADDKDQMKNMARGFLLL